MEQTETKAVVPVKEETPLARVQNYLEAPQIRQRFAEMMGERGARTYISSVLLAVAESKALQTCAPVSVYTSALRAATLRLSVDPGIGQAYLVPFSGRATLIVGYKGLYDMAVRTGKYRYINVGPIYEGEDVIEDRITGFHRLAGGKKSQEVVGWLGAFEMTNGYAKTVYMTIAEIHEHGKQYSPSYARSDGLWKKEPRKMERKTVLRLMLRRWGYIDPNDMEVLEQAENENNTIEAEFNTIAENLSQRGPEDQELPRSREQALSELGFAPDKNPDPVDDALWATWNAMCVRAEKVDVAYPLVNRESITRPDLQLALAQLSAEVEQAEAEAKAKKQP